MSTDPHPSFPEAELFRCEVSPERDTVRIRLVGELDLASAPILDTQLTELRDAGFRRILLDLRDLLFIDSTGLHLILRYDEESRRDGFSLALVPGSPEVQRVFDIAGATTQLPFT